jgi:hypothetical protein
LHEDGCKQPYDDIDRMPTPDPALTRPRHMARQTSEQKDAFFQPQDRPL